MKPSPKTTDTVDSAEFAAWREEQIRLGLADVEAGQVLDDAELQRHFDARFRQHADRREKQAA